MQKVKVKLKKEITYEKVISVTPKEYEMLKGLKNTDVQEYDVSQATKGDDGYYHCPPNEVYGILEEVDKEVYVEPTFFDVYVIDVE